MMEALRKLNQEGQSCFKSGDFPKAVSFFQEAASLALKYGLLQLYATNMNNMAIVYRSMKEFEKAETAYVSILNTLPRGDIHYSQNLTNLADLYCERTDYHKARDYYLQALKIEKGTLFRKKSPDYLHTAFRLAAVYNTLGDYRQAETLFRQILPSIEKELGPQHIGYEAALNGLATVYQGLKNYSKAEPLFQRILAIQEKRVGKDHPEYLKTVSILHQIYSATGQADKALPLTRQVLVAALKNSDLDTFLATLLPKIDAETKEHKALIATVLNETAVQISNEAMRQLKEDTTGEAVEPVKEITRAISFFQKAAEWGCEEAVRNQAKMTNMVCELAATTIEKVTLDPSIVNDVEKAKAAEASGAFDEAIALYGQALEKTSEEHQLTVKLRLASCLKTQAGKNLKAALGRLNNDRNQHQTRINQELDGFFKTHLRKKATLQDGQCVKCAAPAGFKITTADKKDFLLCASHYEDVKAIMNRLPPSTEFMSEALYFADEDLSRADQLIPDNQEIRSLLDQVRQLKPGFPSYTPYSPGSFGNQNARAINPDPPQAGPGPRQDDSVKSRRMEITLDPFPDNMVGVKCDGRHSHAFSRSSLIDVTPAALEEPRIYGEKIYRALFPAGTPAQAGIMSGPDRILLVAPDDLQEIPWEYAFGPEGFVVLNRHFVRGLPPEQRLALPTLDTSLWIVAVPAQPLEEGLEPLNIDGEWSILTESIQGVPYGIWLERTVPPTLDHLREIVANKRNRIVHFMGHGKIIGDDTVLCFENPYGGMEHVKTDYFVQRLKETVFLVTLNACFTAMKLAGDGIPYALGMRTKVNDEDSLAVSRVLYGELARGSSVEEAVRQVRQKLAASSRKGAFGILVLYSSLDEPAPGFLSVAGASRIIEHCPPREISALPRTEGKFMGRFKELLEIGKCLTGDRRPPVLTIHGVGGQGKTALARNAVKRFGHAFPGGVWAVSLESLPSCEKLVRRLAHFLDMADAEKTDLEILTRLLLKQLQRQRTLIVLDNAETLVEAVDKRDLTALELSQFIRQSLISTNVSLLVTSRSHLCWAGETVIELGGLDPEAGASLFFQCIPLGIGEDDRMADRIFRLGGLAEDLSGKIEGHPLGLYLLGKAYAESKRPLQQKGLEEFIKQLDHSLINATDKFQADTHRHHNINTCIDMSINLLTEEQRALFGTLRIFQAYFLPELVAAVVGKQNAYESDEFMGIIMDIGDPRDPEDDPVSEFTPIHNKSNSDGYFGGDHSLYENLDVLWHRGLLMREVVTIKDNRETWQVLLYRLLPAIQSYVASRFGLNQAENDILLSRFGESYAVFARTLASEMKSSTIMRVIIEKCFADLERGEKYATGKAHADYLMALSTFQKRYGKNEASLKTAQQAAEELNALPEESLSKRDIKRMPQDQIEAQIAVAFNMSEAGDAQGALDKFAEILAACQENNDKPAEAQTLLLIGQRHRLSGNSKEAIEYIQKALELYKKEKDKLGEGSTLNDLGLIYLTNLGKLKKAMKYFETALKVLSEKPQNAFQQKDMGLYASVLNNIGETNRQMGNHKKAMVFYEQALPRMHELYDESEAVTLYNLGATAKALGDKSKSKQYFNKALLCSQELGNADVEAAVYIEQAPSETPEQGEDLLKRACQIYHKYGKSVFEASALGSLANHQMHMGKITEARKAMQEAVCLLEKHHLNQDAGGASLKQHKDFLNRLLSMQGDSTPTH